MRLILLCHASTPATWSAAFPADEALDDKGRQAAVALAGRLPAAARTWSSPARPALETAACLGLAPETEPALRDCDHGRWAGLSLDQVSDAEPDAVMAWLSDPTATPHGGESIADLAWRVGVYLDRLQGEGAVVAVTHASVARAAVVYALDAPLQAFWRIDTPPLSSVDLWRGPRGWTLRATRLRAAPEA